MNWGKLKVWQVLHSLVVDIYKHTAKFPKSETYGLVDQLRRAAASAPANIVEGQSRHTTKEYLSFLYNARGSLEETRYFLLLSRDLNFLKESDYRPLEERYESASKMLNGLFKSLKEKL